MIQALGYAATLACLGYEQIDFGDAYVAIDPPAPGERTYLYRRGSDDIWSIHLFTIDYRLDGPLCKAVPPEFAYGRMEVAEKALCPSKPHRLEPVALNLKTRSQPRAGFELGDEGCVMLDGS